jgi:hypothetical protein
MERSLRRRAIDAVEFEYTRYAAADLPTAALA